MSNNIPNLNPADFIQLYPLLNRFIKSYLVNNLFTIDLMEVAGVNQDKTVNVKSILYNLDTKGNVIENKDTINNIRVLMLKGGTTSIAFNCNVGDVGLYLSLKKDYSGYFVNEKNTSITNDIIFNVANGVFIPFQLNNTADTLIIKNGSGTIEINNGTINVSADNVNVKASNVQIDASNINLGGDGGEAVARVGDKVQVEVLSGSSAGTWSGTIVAGSSTTKSK